MTIELVPLTTATITLSAAPLVLPNTPSGTRMIVEWRRRCSTASACRER